MSSHQNNKNFDLAIGAGLIGAASGLAIGLLGGMCVTIGIILIGYWLEETFK